MTIESSDSRDKIRLILRLPHHTHFVVCLRGTDRDFSCSFVLQFPFPIAFGGTPGVANTRLEAIHGALQSLEQTVHSERAQALVAPMILHAIDCILCDSELVDNLIGVWQANHSGAYEQQQQQAYQQNRQQNLRGSAMLVESGAEYESGEEQSIDTARFDSALDLDTSEDVGRHTELVRRLSLSNHVCVQ